MLSRFDPRIKMANLLVYTMQAETHIHIKGMVLSPMFFGLLAGVFT